MASKRQPSSKKTGTKKRKTPVKKSPPSQQAATRANALSAMNARIHEHGMIRLDGVLDFVSFAARPMPLPSLLDDAPERLARIFDAEIASIYLLEGEGDELVMRGNVGFGGGALGQVRLSVGEGIVGSVIELMRPVSLVVAHAHKEYRHFPELGEERFPVFAAVPILGKTGPLGVVVLQRARVPFTDADVELLTALAATIAGWVRAAELMDTTRDYKARKSGGGTRKMTLTGRPLRPGRALGAIAAIKRPPKKARDVHSERDLMRLRTAFDVTAKALQGLVRRASRENIHAPFLRTYLDIVSDARLREESFRLVREGRGVAESLGQVARAVARSAASVEDGYFEDRARDIEDLCDALAMIADSDPRAQIPNKAILLADQLTVFDLLVSARAHPVGIALSEHGAGARNQALVALLGVPAVADVGGLFRWAADGDIALLDGDHGLVSLNPTRAEIALLRKERKLNRDGGDVPLGSWHAIHVLRGLT